MFDPLLWIGVADELAVRREEAHLRTAIGRVYYALFVKTRDELESAGLLQPRGDDSDHRAVVARLQTRRGNAALILTRLRRARNASDYEPDSAVGHSTWASIRSDCDEYLRLVAPDWSRP